ncbi:MAG: hypothetical protein ABI760_05945 [Ferruginibacter sp.]
MRKRFLIIAVTLSITYGINAQMPAEIYYKKFRVDLTAGVDIRDNKIMGSVQAYGAFISIEPRYNFTDNAGIGLRFLYGEVYNNFKEEVATRRNKTLLLNFLYISGVTGSSKRPVTFWNTRVFLGIGLGITSYKNKADTVLLPLAPGKKIAYTGTGFAFMPRFGVDIGKFTLEYFYYYTINKGANYGGASIGFYFGGGRLE